MVQEEVVDAHRYSKHAWPGSTHRQPCPWTGALLQIKYDIYVIDVDVMRNGRNIRLQPMACGH